MKEFKKGDKIRIKLLKELKYVEQDELSEEDFANLGKSAKFMFNSGKSSCVISIDNHMYEVPEWIITKDESESLISRTFRTETYQRTDRKLFIERIAYLVEKTAFKFTVTQTKKEIILNIEL